MSMRMVATDSASVRAACPVRPGRIAVSPGCKTKACSVRTPKQNESAARPPVSAQPPTQRGADLDFLYFRLRPFADARRPGNRRQHRANGGLDCVPALATLACFK